MKTLLTTALATFALAATPALAQTGQDQSTQGEAQIQATQPQTPGGQPSQDSATQDSASQDMQSTPGGEGGMTGEELAASQQRVVETLSDAGLTDVRIIDAAFLVQATTPDDEEVMMVVNSSGQPMAPPQVGQSDDTPMRQGMEQAPQGQLPGSGDGQAGSEAPPAN